MKLFYKSNYPINEEVKEREKVAIQGYGTEKAPIIQGFAGYFLWSPPDLYISDNVEAAIKVHTHLKDELVSSLDRFISSDDWGDINEEEEDMNIENRYMFGLNCWMTARYETSCGTIVIRTMIDFGMICFEEENIDYIIEAQERRIPIE